MMKTQTIYLVDTENVNEVWVDAIAAIQPRDKVVAFYTENSPKLSWERMADFAAKGCEFEAVRCHKGTNALDFQLVSYLGYMAASGPSCRYVIISNDKGYDPVSYFWQERGIQIQRQPVQTRLEKQTDPRPDSKESVVLKIFKRVTGQGQAARPERREESRQGQAARPERRGESRQGQAARPERREESRQGQTARPKKTEKTGVRGREDRPAEGAKQVKEVDLQAARILAKSVRVSREADFRQSLNHLLGVDLGNQVFEQLDAQAGWKEEARRAYLTNVNGRLRNYVDVFLRMNRLPQADRPQICKILRRAEAGHLADLHQEFVKNFDEEKGTTYYRLFKGNLRVIQFMLRPETGRLRDEIQ